MKFNIRDLLWFIVAVAVLMAWVVDRQSLRKENLQLRNQSGLEAAGHAAQNEKLQRQLDLLREEQQQIYSGLPNSSAPTPNPPKE